MSGLGAHPTTERREDWLMEERGILVSLIQDELNFDLDKTTHVWVETDTEFYQLYELKETGSKVCTADVENVIIQEGQPSCMDHVHEGAYWMPHTAGSKFTIKVTIEKIA